MWHSICFRVWIHINIYTSIRANRIKNLFYYYHHQVVVVVFIIIIVFRPRWESPVHTTWPADKKKKTHIHDQIMLISIKEEIRDNWWKLLFVFSQTKESHFESVLILKFLTKLVAFFFLGSRVYLKDIHPTRNYC